MIPTSFTPHKPLWMVAEFCTLSSFPQGPHSCFPCPWSPWEILGLGSSFLRAQEPEQAEDGKQGGR